LIGVLVRIRLSSLLGGGKEIGILKGLHRIVELACLGFGSGGASRDLEGSVEDGGGRLGEVIQVLRPALDLALPVVIGEGMPCEVKDHPVAPALVRKGVRLNWKSGDLLQFQKVVAFGRAGNVGAGGEALGE